MQNFKPGDKVYFPAKSTKVLTVQNVNGNPSCLMLVDGYCLMSGGKISNLDCNPSIFHATEENRLILEALYGVEFDKL